MFSLAALHGGLFAAIYEIGPGKPYTTIGAAPWATLQAGDTVRIYYSATPYREKWVINRTGAAQAPITITGVLGPNGQRPIIEGANATTPKNLSFWNEGRGLVKIGGANVPGDIEASYIILENLEIRGARPTYSYTNRAGARLPYDSNAASLYIERCRNCTIRNNVIHNGANAVFVSSGASYSSTNIVFQNNYIYNGGIVGSAYHHNVYSTALNILFEGNRFGALIAGSAGNNIKDRSAGVVIRYNWIEGGNRQFDFSDAATSEIVNHPSYRNTYVYGNVIREFANEHNRQIVYYGGDSGNSTYYRKGTLHFYNNTVVVTRTQGTLFRPATNDETIDARNNVFFIAGDGSNLAIVDTIGQIRLNRNWAKTGIVTTMNSPFNGTIVHEGPMLTGSSPGFVDELGQDFRLTAASPLIGVGANLNPLALPANAVAAQYRKHLGTEPRPVSSALDIGAFGSTGSQPGSTPGATNASPVAHILLSSTTGIAPHTINLTGAGSHDPDGSIAGYAWTTTDGGVSSAMAFTRSFNRPGTYIIRLTVTDNKGATGSTAATLTLSALPPPVISGVVTGGNVSLSWTDPSAGKALVYYLDRRLSGGAWSQIAAPKVRTFVDARTPGVYEYRVRAGNAFSTSTYSNTYVANVK